MAVRVLEGREPHGTFVKTPKKPIDLGSSDGTKPLGNPNWRAETIAKETYFHDPESKYAKFLIPKFSKLAKGARLKPQRLAEMRIRPNLTPQERELLTEMLHNREAVLSWNFDEMGKVREDVVPPPARKTYGVFVKSQQTTMKNKWREAEKILRVTGAGLSTETDIWGNEKNDHLRNV